jgi:hypothetical protein
MKRLNIYILEELMILENSNGEIITEGFWKKLGSIFGFSTEKVAKTMQKWSDDLKKGFTTGQYIAAKSKDKEVKKAAEEQAQAAEKGSKELLKKVKFEVQRLMKVWDHIESPDHALSQWNQLKNLSEQENDNEGKQLAEKFKGIIDKKFPDGGKQYEKISQKIEKAGVDDGPKDEKSNNKENTNDSEGQPKIDPKKDSSNIGTTDDNKPAEVTPEQQDNAIKDTIKDDTDFYSPLAKAAGIDGNTLKDGVSKFINKAWKEAVKDENGNAVLKWKNGSIEGQKNMQDNLEDNIVKGLSAILCGIMIIKNKSLMQGVYDVIDPEGRGKEEIKKLLEIK